MMQRWCNERLEPRNITIRDITQELSDGEILLKLLEVVSGVQKLPGANKLKTSSSTNFKAMHQRENVNLVLKNMADLGILKTPFQLSAAGLNSNFL